MDKHRTLALTGVAMTGFGFGIRTMRDISIEFGTVGFTGPFDQNTELANWNTTVTGPNPQMDMQPHGPLEIGLAPPCIQAGEPLIATLKELSDYVTEIVEILREIGTRTAVP
jgi:hypothetical protein